MCLYVALCVLGSVCACVICVIYGVCCMECVCKERVLMYSVCCVRHDVVCAIRERVMCVWCDMYKCVVCVALYEFCVCYV